MSEQNKWHWQKKGTAWKGIGIYHVTLTISSRQPLLGRLVIPDNDATQAKIERTEMGRQVVHALALIPSFHPEIRLLQYCLMPDHLHAVLYVTKEMKVGIKTVVRGFWQGAKKIGREHVSSVSADNTRDNKQNIGNINPLFTEMPFIRPMSHKGQLQTMIRYVQMNPQRLATKRLHPGFFRVQEGIEIAGRTYKGVGNIALLQAASFATVHVRRSMVEEAEHGDNQRLRDYMNGCVLQARRGTIMISPFINPHEKQVMDILLQEKHSFVYVADNGFGDYYKPQAGLFDAVATGKVLILSPWNYDKDKHHVSRAECVLLNQMADEIANCLTIPQQNQQLTNKI